MRSGFVSIIGRPNVGKSTLINSLLETKLAITSDKVGTTRNVIQGIYNDDDSQIIFIDTPGINKPIDKLGSVLNKKSYNAVEEVDLILFLIDAKTGIGKKDMEILDRLKEKNVDTFLIINKLDKVNREDLIKSIIEYKDIYPFKEIIPISALKDKNIEELIKTIKEYLPIQDKLYNDEMFTNISTSFYVSEIVREKVLNLTKEEVPHSVTCAVESLIEEEDKVIINVVIIVDRDSLKKIIIGKNGNMIKEIGIKSRIDLEEYFGKKVYLETFVKTIKNWRDKEIYLQELGLNELNN